MERALRIPAGMTLFGLAVLLGLHGCQSDMAEQPSPPPSAGPRAPVEGTLPTHGRFPLDRSQMAALYPVNPLASSEQAVEAGRQEFFVFCAPCHGSTGKGDGPVAAKFIPPTDLASPFIQENTDGWFYGTIRNGVRLMPRYATELTEEQSWQIVTFIRTFKEE
jgi:mono/diheme cytochrome c family protein